MPSLITENDTTLPSEIKRLSHLMVITHGVELALQLASRCVAEEAARPGRTGEPVWPSIRDAIFQHLPAHTRTLPRQGSKRGP